MMQGTGSRFWDVSVFCSRHLASNLLWQKLQHLRVCVVEDLLV